MSQDLYYSNNSLLLHCDGTNASTTFTDTSPTPKTVTSNGGAALSTSLAKFGTASGSFTASKYLTLDGSSAFAFGTGDFTIEFWVYPTTLTSGSVFYDSRPASTSGVYPVLDVTTGNFIRFSNDAGFVITATLALTLNAWNFVALSRVSGTTRLFINGTQSGGNYTDSKNYIVGTSRPIINGYGFTPGNNIGIIGNYDDIRVTKGVGRYTTAFSIPTDPFSNDGYNHSFFTTDHIISITPDFTMGQKFIFLGNGKVIVYPVSSFLITRHEQISETVDISQTVISGFISSIVESLLLLDSSLSILSAKESISEYLRIIDYLNVTLLGLVNESIMLSPVIIDLLNKIIEVLEDIKLISELSNKALFIHVIVDSLITVDSLLHGILEDVLEVFGINQTFSDIHHAVSILLDSLSIIDSLDNTFIKIGIISDDIKVLGNFSTIANFLISLSDGFVLSVPGVTRPNTYLAYLLNAETNSVSKYLNYNFTNCTKFGSKYLFGNSTGLYEYGGTDDDGEKITAHLKTVAYNFGTSNLKQVPEIYLGGVSSDKMVLKVNVDNKASVYYRLNRRIDDLSTQRIQLGKGLIGRYFQFELITDSVDLDIESLEFYPVILKRKI